MTDQLVRVDDLDSAATSQAQAIFEAGFAEHLRVPWPEVSSERRADETSLVLLRDGEPVVFALLRALGTTDRTYLRYIVVDESRRGQGVGSAAWASLLQHCRETGFALLVWDVEDPAEPGIGVDEQRIRPRRIAFYERLGGVVVPTVGYTNPHEAADGTQEAPMVLMAATVDGSVVPVDDAQWVGDLVRDVNRHRWNR